MSSKAWSNLKRNQQSGQEYHLYTLVCLQRWVYFVLSRFPVKWKWVRFWSFFCFDPPTTDIVPKGEIGPFSNKFKTPWTSDQRALEKSQEKNKWLIISSSLEQRIQIFGPWKHFFNRRTQVWIQISRASQIKHLSFGRKGQLHSLECQHLFPCMEEVPDTAE